MVVLRGPFSALGGAVFAAVIFLGLAQLVSVPFDVPPLTPATRVIFTPQRVDTPVEPTRPRKPEPPPNDFTLIEPRGRGVTSNPIGLMPRKPIDVARPPRTGLPLGVDRDAVPLVRINPDYPPRAAERNIEGWVQVRYTVTSAGTVRDAIVVTAEPKGVFDDAALEAIARWRYNPRVENGETVERVGLQTLIRFELEN
jgi:protein TonB